MLRVHSGVSVKCDLKSFIEYVERNVDPSRYLKNIQYSRRPLERCRPDASVEYSIKYRYAKNLFFDYKNNFLFLLYIFT